MQLHNPRKVIIFHILLLLFGVSIPDGIAESTESTLASEREVCPEDSVDTNHYGTFVFPETEAKVHGVDVKVVCPFGFQSNGFQAFNEDADSWLEKQIAQSGVTRQCFLKSENGTWIGKWEPPEVLESHINNCRSKALIDYIDMLTAALETITPNNFRQAYYILVNLQKCALEDYGCAQAYINGIASLLTSPKLNGEDGITKKDRDRLFFTTAKFASEVADVLDPGFKFQVGDAGITLDTAKFYGKRSTKMLKDAKGNQIEPSQWKPYISRVKTAGNGDISIGISGEALHMASERSDTDDFLRIIAYSNNIFATEHNESDVAYDAVDRRKVVVVNTTCEEQSKDDNGTDNALCSEHSSPHTSTFCNDYQTPDMSWGVICIELAGEVEDLKDPVEFSISKLPVLEGYKFRCVYWDVLEGNWSTKGVRSEQLDDGVRCTTTHLSAFSALIEPLPLPFPGAEYAPINNSIHSFILEILSSVGSVLSIIGLSFTLMTYSLFRSLRRERNNRILINLCASLLFMHIMSLSASRSLWDGHCFVPSASLHYLVLTSLAWMMTEAINMYHLLISVFVRPENRFMLKRILLAWGIPLIVVSACTIADPTVYKVGRASLCLMSAHANIILYYVAYIVPICIMLLVNLVVFCRIFRVLYQQTKRTKEATKRHGEMPKQYLTKISPAQIKGATSILILLGVGWVLGLAAVGPFEVFFRYMYCVCNAGQGLFIFIFRVALNPHACKQWKKVLLGISPDSSLDSSETASSTTGIGKRMKRKDTVISQNFISAANSVENSLTASNPLSATLAATLASILKSENGEKAPPIIDNSSVPDGQINA